MSTHESAGHVISHAPYLGICKCAASKKVCRLSGSSSPSAGRVASRVVSCIGDSMPSLNCVLKINSVGEYKSMIFKAYRDPLPIHPRW